MYEKQFRTTSKIYFIILFLNKKTNFKPKNNNYSIMKNIYTILFCFLILCACREDNELANFDSSNANSFNYKFESISGVLADLMKDSNVRKYMKKRSLEKFDGDYNVLFQDLLSVSTLTGETVKQKLNKENPQILSAIMTQPLLTLLVPSLHKFSADNWDTENDPLPLIAFSKENNEIYYTAADGFSFTQSIEFRPTFPVIILKQNENLVLSHNAQNNMMSYNSNDFNYSYITNPLVDIRDNYNSNKREMLQPDPKVLAAYTKALNNPTCNTCYQKDYIYYDISPSDEINRGEFNKNYTEAITSLKVESYNVLETITDDWTEGNLELHFNIFFIGASDQLSVTTKTFILDPENLYNTEYETICKEFPFPIPGKEYCFEKEVEKVAIEYIFNPAIQIVPWDMQLYGDRWHIQVEEYDPSTQITRTVSAETTKGSNFEAEVGADIFKIVKIGAGLGSNSTSTKSSNMQVTYTTESDQLGSIIHTWYNPVITAYDPLMIDVPPLGQLPIPKWEGFVQSTGTVVVGIETLRTSK
ncbi:hypothetical protein [Fulvivirga sediminis]|uniref:Uncharacterized protein n=1 Tax=Fulvivirga sediminis TaxID=2803949 RepID=A0A937K1M1_9BACT|nr:hypothetical protein [Fulvivirga sediminis]MBL3657641.1 hypothetical protein [Fulvivirga sediminis]